MKKITKCLVTFLAAALFAMSFVGCFGAGGGGNNKPDEKPETTIQIYNGTAATSYTLTIGEDATIDIPGRPGYYFVGAYDQEEGGVKYFNSRGQSSMVWAEGLPATFYARFEELSGLEFAKILQEDTPYKWGNGEISFEFDLSQEIIGAISANLDADVHMTVSFDAISDMGWSLKSAHISNQKTAGEKYYFFNATQKDEYPLPKDFYKTFTKNITVKARWLKSGKIYCFVKTEEIVVSGKYGVKNIKLALNFA